MTGLSNIQGVAHTCAFFGDSPMVTPPVGPTIFSINLLYIKPVFKPQPLCLNGTRSCVDFMDVIMGDISLFLSEFQSETSALLCRSGAGP